MVKGWHYYNHAMVPDCHPYENVDLTAVNDGSIWHNTGGGTPLLVSWVSDFDCGYETNWWYCIKDDPFDITSLKSKRRYIINQGKNNFDVKRINPEEYAEHLFDVEVKAFTAYPEKYRPVLNREAELAKFHRWQVSSDKTIVLGAFDKTGRLSGYCHLVVHKKYCAFSYMKSDPEKERLQINAALVEGVLREVPTGNGYYISDGARSIFHETHFQDYLEKYFGFRKAYCILHVVYNPKIRWFVKVLYPFRKLLIKMDSVGLVHKINSVLKMEDIMRKQPNTGINAEKKD